MGFFRNRAIVALGGYQYINVSVATLGNCINDIDQYPLSFTPLFFTCLFFPSLFVTPLFRNIWFFDMLRSHYFKLIYIYIYFL